jgi:hypothetical protein
MVSDVLLLSYFNKIGLTLTGEAGQASACSTGNISVGEEQCCGSGMFIPDPDFTHPGSLIPDPKTATKERGEKKLVVIPFYVATNFTKL